MGEQWHTTCANTSKGEFPRYFLVLSGLSYGTRIPSRAMHKLGAGPRSQPVALIRVAWLIPVVSFLRSIGAPVEQLLARAHLSGSMFDDPEDLLSVSPPDHAGGGMTWCSRRPGRTACVTPMSCATRGSSSDKGNPPSRSRSPC